jgi:hypothetical protein
MALTAEALAEAMVNEVPAAWNSVMVGKPWTGFQQDGVDTGPGYKLLFLAITKALFGHLTASDRLTITDANQNSITLDASGIAIRTVGASITLDMSSCAIMARDATINSSIRVDTSSVDIDAATVSINNGALEVR